MTQPSPYRVSLDDLERDVRVERDETVESQALVDAPAADPRGESPDREWFEAGG
jgi:hypothetical protein